MDFGTCQRVSVRRSENHLLKISEYGKQSLEIAKGLVNLTGGIYQKFMEKNDAKTMYQFGTYIIPSLEMFILFIVVCVFNMLTIQIIINMDMLSKFKIVLKISRKNWFRIALTYIPVMASFFLFSVAFPYYYYASPLLTSVKSYSSDIELIKKEALQYGKSFSKSYTCQMENDVTRFKFLQTITDMYDSKKLIDYIHDISPLYECLFKDLPTWYLTIVTEIRARKGKKENTNTNEDNEEASNHFSEVVSASINEFFDNIQKLHKDFFHLEEIESAINLSLAAFSFSFLTMLISIFVVYATIKQFTIKNKITKIVLYTASYFLFSGVLFYFALFIKLLVTTSSFVYLHQFTTDINHSPVLIYRDTSNYNVLGSGFGSRVSFSMEKIFVTHYIEELMNNRSTYNKLQKAFPNADITLEDWEEMKRKQIPKISNLCGNDEAKKKCLAEDHISSDQFIKGCNVVGILNGYLKKDKKELIPFIYENAKKIHEGDDIFLWDDIKKMLDLLESKIIVPLAILMRMTIMLPFIHFLLVLYVIYGLSMIVEQKKTVYN